MDEALHRWKTHYESILNPAPSDDGLELCNLANHKAIDSGTNIDLPLLEEVCKASWKLQNGCTTGPDGIPSELLKGALGPLSIGLHELFLKM